MKQDICRFYCYWNTRKPNNIKTDKHDKIELVLFDMDGVLTDIISSWRHIHEYFGSSNENSVNDYLKGKIDDLEFIRRDISLWRENGKPARKKTIEKVLSDVPIMKGAPKCINELKSKGIKTAIVSAGLDILSERVANELGIKYCYSNGVKTDKNGFLTGDGYLQVKLMYKDKIVKAISDQLNIAFENIAAIGNSCFDIPMFEACGLGIAFNPDDDCVRKLADIVVEGKDLSRIIPTQEPFV